MRTHATPSRTRPVAPRQRLPRPAGPALQRQRNRVREILHPPRHEARVQAKLTVGPPGDAHEREADRVADRVMRLPEDEVRRACAQCQDELRRQPLAEEEEEVREKRHPGAGEGPRVTPDLEARIQGMRGGGQPLPESARGFFEPRFGQDFGAVRVHTGPQAAGVASILRARAFTVGSDVVFGAQQYAPETDQGKRLLAHELTHVVQQSAGGSAAVQRATDPMADITTFQSPGGSGWWGAKFGCYRNSCKRKHQGWDVHASTGTECKAAVEGTTTHHTDSGGYGDYVQLTSKADAKKKYIYAHLSAREAAGTVAEGAKVGETGITGNASSDRPHLHFAVKEDTKFVNPADSFTEPTKVVEASGSTATTIDKTAAEPCTPCTM